MAGPGIEKQITLQGAGLLDLAPTVLHLMGFEPPPGLAGRVLNEAMSTPHDVKQKLSFPHALSPPASLTASQTELLTRRWRELGLAPPESQASIHESVRHQYTFNKAVVAMDSRRTREAARLFETLHSEVPDDDRYAIHLARCRRKLGDIDGSRRLLESVVDHHDPRPLEQMELASLHLASGEAEKALVCLFRAEQAEGRRPSVHARIGEVYLAMNHWEEARAAFQRGLDRDPEHAASLRGMAACELAMGHLERATEAALRAIAAEHDSLQGHLLLGRALLAQGDGQHALQALRACLSFDSKRSEVHQKLHEACLLVGDKEGAENHLLRAHQLRAASSVQQQLKSLYQ